MARPLRIDQAVGWYHLTSRGNERGPRLVLGRRECGLKLGALGELCGGLDYRTVRGAVKKAMTRLVKDRGFLKTYASARKKLLVAQT